MAFSIAAMGLFTLDIGLIDTESKDFKYLSQVNTKLHLPKSGTQY